VTVLRRSLLAFAVVWAGCGTAVAVVPRWVLVDLFDQVRYPDYAYVRVSGTAAIGLALLAVLVSRSLDSVWWWSWAFVLSAALTATVTTLNAIFSVPPGSGTFLWWVFAATNAALAAGLLVGLGRAGQEKPFV
jgi:hypothetical protein